MDSNNTFALIAEQLYTKLSQDLQALSLSVQSISQQMPNLKHALSEIYSKVQNCEVITLANTSKLETIDNVLTSAPPPTPASSAHSAPPVSRKNVRITKKVCTMAKSLYVVDYVENDNMHGTYKKKLEAAEIDPEEIPEYLQRQAEKLFDAMTRHEQDPYIKRAQDMVN